MSAPAGSSVAATRGRRVASGAAALAILIGSIALSTFGAPSASADPAPGPGSFASSGTGALTPGTVPDGACAARISATGGAGASAAAIGATGGQGAPGAAVTARFAVLPLQSSTGSVGGGGAVSRTGGVGGGGTGSDAPVDHDGAGGGGRSVVAIAGNTLVIAGGGGGAGASHFNSPRGNGGAAGFNLVAAGVATGTAGSAGQDTNGTPGGGQGGQVAAGGAGGVHTVTTARNGTAGGGPGTGTGGNGGNEPNYDGGGGGGAGYTGGGGGAATDDQSVAGAGGGGGSSFIAAASPVVAATAPSLVSGAAGATPALGAAGANGSVAVDWLPCLYDLTLTKTPSVAAVNAGGRITWTINVTNNGPDPMTRGDTLTLTDTLPSGSNATSPTPNNVVTSVAVSGGSNANLTSGALTCTGVTVGAAMPTSTVCSRAYAGAAGTPGSPSGGTRGLNVGETLTITYDQIISNTAACGTITDTSTVVDRPTQNTSVPTNTTGNAVTDTAAGTVTINCYDLGVTKTVSPTPGVVPGGTVTWTITVMNNGPGNMTGPDATTPNPLVVTDTFPTTGVGTPTLVSSIGPAGACTRSGSTITCPGSLNAGQQQVLTFTQAVNAGATLGSTITNTATVTDPRTGDTNDSSTASTQVVAAPRLVLQKSLGGQNRFAASDQFVMTIGGPGGGTATTGGSGSAVTGGSVTVASGTAGSSYTLSEAMAPGSASTLGQYASSIACTNAFAGSSTILPAGPGTSFTLTPQVSDNITCTYTNTPRGAQVTVAKTSLGGTGSFGFTMTNLAASSATVATSTAGVPAGSGPIAVTTLNSAVTITETVPSGWRATAATCTDANAAVTGNSGTFGLLSGNVITVPASFIEPAADITCTFTNQKLARLAIQKTTDGGGGTFSYSTTGGLTPSTFTLSPNPPATPSATQSFVDLVPGTYTVTEAPGPPFQLTGLTCIAAPTSAPGSTVTTSLANRRVSATLVAGADYTCTFTNTRDAPVTLVKTSVGGDGTFGFTTTGTGNPTDPAPSITTSAGTGSSAFAVLFAPGVTSRTLTITENALPAGWVLSGIACTNGSGAPVGTVTPGSVTLTLTPVDTVNCNFTNERLPRVTLRKQSNGTTGSFQFVGGTNGLPSNLVLDTAVANPATSTTYQLNALRTATSITEAVSPNFRLDGATCVDGSGTAVSTSLSGGTLTIAASATGGGADLTCTFVNTRRSAQVRVDKRWQGANLNDQVTISSTGGTNNPGLVSVANSANEVDAGVPVTVFAGETLTFAETFNVGSAAAYDTSLQCTGATDNDPANGLAITSADDGATIVCTYTNSRVPNVVKTAGSVSGPTAAGIFTAAYTVSVDNPGGATTYGALTDTPAFAPNLEVTGATWTASTTSGPAPSGGASVGAGPFTLAPPGQAIAAGATHTFTVAVTFRFTTYAPAAPCAGPGSGLFNTVVSATPELDTTDNAACSQPPAPPTAAVDIVKNASPGSVTAAGQTVSYTFAVTNTGNVNLTNVAVVDPLPGLSVISCTVSTLAPGASTTCTATYITTQADVDAGAIGNTATVSANAPNGASVGDSASAVVTAARAPAIGLVKNAAPTTVSAPGQTITYTFVVTNTGNVTLTSVSVADPLPGLSAITCADATLGPTATTTCTATYVSTQGDIDGGAIANTATATGSPPLGAGPPVTANASASVTATRTPGIELVKSATPNNVTAAGQTVTYTFVVSNTGNVTLTSVSVADPLPGLSAITCADATLAPTATTTCNATYVATQADIDAGSIDNTATASGLPPAGPAVTDTDDETVTAVAGPAIQVVKTGTPNPIGAAGDVVTYSFAVTNTGNVTLTSVGVADPLPGLSAVSCPVSTLAPNASTTCTATYAATQADIDAGSITNTATVSGTPPSGPDVSDADDETVTAVSAPAVSIDKTALPTSVTVAGQTVTYSFAVTNTGNVTLSSVGVSDLLPGLSAITCPSTTVAPGVTLNCTATYVATQADIDLGSITNTATVSGTPPSGSDVTDTDDATVTAASTPAISLDKSAAPSSVTAAGQTVTYSFAVANTGNVTLTSVGVTDPLAGLSPIVCAASTLAPAVSTTCSATYVATQADIDAGSIENTATASGLPPVGPAVTDSDDATVTAVSTPSVSLVKTAAPNSVTAAGQTVTYSFAVTNTGNVTLTSVGVVDPLPGLSAVSCPVSMLAPIASTTCSATYVATQADIDAGSIENTATASGLPPVGPAVTDTDDETVTAAPAPSVGLVKTASPTTISVAGQTVTYSFAVTNTGNVTLTSVGVTDPLPRLSAVSCPVTTLAPTASTVCSATYVASQADIDAGSITNTATVSGTPPSGPDVTDTDDATVTASSTPTISLDKSAAPNNVTAAGQTVTYSFAVTNTGNVTLTSVGVTDPLPSLSPITCPVSTLAPAASTTCTATYVATQADIDAGSIDNTATASGLPPAGAAVSDSDSESVTATAGPAIQVVKTASPATVSASGQTITYSFAVTNTGNVTLTSVGVTDPLPGLSAVSCPVSTLLPSASTTCSATYVATQADIDAGSITNTATVSGTPPAGAPVSDTDGETVTAVSAASVSLVKSASPGSVTAAGQTVIYTFAVTNTGNVTLTSVGVADPLTGLSAISCPVTTLGPTASTTCTATYVVTQANMDAGSIINTATATGTPPAAPAVSDSDGETVTAISAASIGLVKSASPNTVSAAGQTVTYSFAVTNTGNVTLTSVDLTDPLAGLSPIVCPVSTLAPTASTTCNATYVATQADIDAGSITNTATVSGTPPSGPDVTDTEGETVTAVSAPAISLDKTASPNSVTAAGQTVTYSFAVTNTGNVTLTSVDVSDALAGLSPISCPVSTLAPSASTTCTATYLATQADIDAGSITNTATVSGSPPSGPDVTDTDGETVTAAPAPSVGLVKAASPATVSASGQTITYSFAVTNTGNVTLTSVGVTDPLPGLSAVSCPVSTLLPSASTTCSATYVATQADIDAGTIINTATASGLPPAGPEVSDTDDETVTAVPAPAISLDKSATPNNVTAAGQTVAYTFAVTNTGNVTLTSVGVTDPLPGLSAVSCPVNTLAPGASTTCTATYVATQADIDDGVIDNTATASGLPPAGAAVTDSDSESVTAVAGPEIQVVKTGAPNPVGAAGDVVTYSFTVTNTGNVNLTSIDVADPLPGLSAVTCPVSTLAPNASTVCTATYVTTQADIDAGSIANTATVSGSPPSGPDVTDTDDETVTALSAPAIGLGKSASPTSVGTAGSTITYTFAVTNTGNVTLTAIDVTDPLPGLSAISCPVSTLAPSASTTCTATYVVTQADIDAGSITNTATVSGSPPSGPDVTDTDGETVTAVSTPAIGLDKTASPTSVGTAGSTITYTFAVTNTGNVTLTAIGVTDPLPGLSAVACPVSTLAPGVSTTCTATYVATQADVDAGQITNTATATGTPPAGSPVSDSDTLTVPAGPLPSIELEKSASPTSVTRAGEVVTYSFTVTNTGNVTLNGVTVTDTMPGLGPVSCPGFGGVLAPAESATCTATYTVVEADLSGISIRNAATAVATTVVGAVQVSDTADVEVAVSPVSGIVLRKTVSSASVSSGATVTYTFVVTNTGASVLTHVAVTDPLAGLGPVVCPGFDGVLSPHASTTCTATYRVTTSSGRITNVARVNGTDPSGAVVVAQASATLTVTGSSAGSTDNNPLPMTGADLGRAFVAGVGIAVVGGGLLVGTRRRRRLRKA